MGTYGTRSLAVGGSAIVKAVDKIIAKGKKIAAHLMEAAVADVEFEQRHLQGRRHRQERAARRRRCSPPTCRTTIRSTSSSPAWTRTPSTIRPTSPIRPGTHICEVEVDPETGVVEVVNFTAVDDFGNIINPMIVEGQVHGGIAQGIGQALLENCVYDKETGQLLTGSYMDYAMPRADDLPSFKLGIQGHALHAQSAGREGLRRGGRDRRAGRRDERRPRRAGAARRQASTCPPRRSRVATPLQPSRQAESTEEPDMYDFAYHRPKTLADAVAALKGKPEARAMSGGMTLIPTLKLRLAKPERRGRPRRHQGSRRHQGRGQRRRPSAP